MRNVASYTSMSMVAVFKLPARAILSMIDYVAAYAVHRGLFHSKLPGYV